MPLELLLLEELLRVVELVEVPLERVLELELLARLLPLLPLRLVELLERFTLLLPVRPLVLVPLLGRLLFELLLTLLEPLLPVRPLLLVPALGRLLLGRLTLPLSLRGVAGALGLVPLLTLPLLLPVLALPELMLPLVAEPVEEPLLLGLTVALLLLLLGLGSSLLQLWVAG